MGLDILAKLDHIYSSAASFEILMQSFFKIPQQWRKGISGFVTRLEGCLSHIRIEHLHRVTEHEAQHHLNDQLFHGL